MAQDYAPREIARLNPVEAEGFAPFEMTDHALERYEEVYPTSTYHRVVSEVERGDLMRRSVAERLRGMNKTRDKDAGTYLLHRERTGCFVVVGRDVGRQRVVTFLRYGKAQQELAVKLFGKRDWPGWGPSLVEDPPEQLKAPVLVPPPEEEVPTALEEAPVSHTHDDYLLGGKPALKAKLRGRRLPWADFLAQDLRIPNEYVLSVMDRLSKDGPVTEPQVRLSIRLAMLTSMERGKSIPRGFRVEFTLAGHRFKGNVFTCRQGVGEEWMICDNEPFVPDPTDIAQTERLRTRGYTVIAPLWAGDGPVT